MDGDANIEEEEEEAAAKPTAVQRTFAQLSESEQRVLVGEVVRFVLLRQRDRAPIKSADVQKHVLGEGYKGLKVRAVRVTRALSHASSPAGTGNAPPR